MRCLFYANLSSELMPPVCAADLCIHARVPASVQYVCPRACVCVCVQGRLMSVQLAADPVLAVMDLLYHRYPSARLRCCTVEKRCNF